eukprot:4355-Heterococcus_DN1.PRE.2
MAGSASDLVATPSKLHPPQWHVNTRLLTHTNDLQYTRINVQAIEVQAPLGSPPLPAQASTCTGQTAASRSAAAAQLVELEVWQGLTWHRHCHVALHR